MLVEQPHHAPSSAREFVRQYAMIVLSILTALALEQLAVKIHDHISASSSRARIEAELASNAHDLQGSLQTDRQINQQVSALLRTLVDHLKSGKPFDAEAEAMVAPILAHFQISVTTFQHSAWEAAIADHSAGDLSPADLQRYSEIYAAAADSEASWQVLLGGEWLTHAAELGLDYRLGKIDQRDLANVLIRFLVAAQQIETSEAEILALIAGEQKRGPKTVSVPH